MTKNSLCILLVDDRDDFRESFASWLRESLGHVVSEAKSFDQALESFSDRHYDLAIVDYSLDPTGSGDGIDLLCELKKVEPDFPVIVITGYGNRPIAKKALRAGALWYLDKPPDLVEIEVLLSQAAKSRDRSSRQIMSAIAESIAMSPDVKSFVFSLCEKAAKILGAEFCSMLVINPETNTPRALPDAWNLAPPITRDNLLDVLRATLTDGEAKIVLASDFILEIPNKFAVKAYASFPCPPRPRPSSVIIAYFAVPINAADAIEIRKSAEEIGQIVGATLTNLYSLQLNEEVRSLGFALLRANSAEEIYVEIAKTIANSFDVAGFSLCLFESATQQISFPIAFERGEALILQPLPLGEVQDDAYQYLSEYVIRTGEPLELADQKSLEGFKVKPQKVGHVSTKSYFAVPVRLDSSQPAFGALSIQSDSEGRFSNSAHRVLREIANVSAPALARLRKVKLGEEVLNHILRNNPQDVVREVAQALKELVFADVVSFYPYNSELGEFNRPSIEIGSRLLVNGESAWPSERQTLERLLTIDEHFASSLQHDETFTGEWIGSLAALSSCGILLRTSGQVQGAIILHFRSSRDFTTEERSEIRRFGERAALALYIAEIIEERKASDRRAKAESDVIYAASTQDRQELSRLLDQAALSVWPKGGVRLQALLHDRRTGNFQTLDGADAGIDAEFGMSIDSQAQDLVSEGFSANSSASTVEVSGKKFLVAAIRVGDSRLGLLLCEGAEPIFAARDQAFLRRLARTLAGTLIAAAREQRVELIREVAVKAAANPSQALGIITELTHRIATGAGGEPTSTTIFLLTGSMLEPVSAFPPDQLAEVRQRIGFLSIDLLREKRRGIVARAAVNKRTELILDVKSDDDYIALDPRTQAELAVPVLGFDREIVGVLNLEFHNPTSLNQDDCALVETLAEQATVVNVLQTQALTLTKAEKMTTMSAALAILGIDATESGHRLKGLLGRLRKEVDLCEAYLKYLRSGSIGLITSPVRWSPKKVHEKFVRALQRLREGLMATDLEGSTESVMERSSLLISAWISRFGNECRQHIGGSLPLVDIDIDDQTRSSDAVYVNEYWLSKSVNILIENAVRSVRKLPAPPRRVVLRTRSSEDKILRIEVHDNGQGIPDEVSRHLFAAQISKDLVDSGGHGTGCLLASFIAQLYDGRIFLLTDAGNGAHVAMEIPLSKNLSPLVFSARGK